MPEFEGLLLVEKKDPDSPATTSIAYDAMLPRWGRIDPLLGGTEAMKDAGARLLPQHEEEGDKAWAERLSSNVLLNMTELILESWVGRPFSDPVKLSDDIAPEIETLTENIDLQGNSLDVFARRWFKQGLAKSFSHVLIDFPAIDPVNLDGSPRTMADDLREGVRPYWVEVRPENLFFAHSVIVDGREVLVHVRIFETVIEMDGFGERVVPQIRVFDAAVLQEDGTFATTVAVYRLKKTRRRKVEWVVESQRVLSIDFIPIVTFYANRESLMVGKAPISDLADLNIRWWQSNSDQISVLTVSRFPMLAGSGVGGSDKVVIGPHTWLTTTDPQGRWYYVEHTGASIEAGRRDLLDLQISMAEYGAEFLKKRPDRETATARALDSAEATSPLQDKTLRFIDAINTAIDMTGMWLGREHDSSGTAALAVDFGPEDAETAYLDQLRFARENGDLSREDYLKELMRIGALPDTFDLAENEKRVKKEEKEAAKAAKKLLESKPAPGPQE